MRNRGICYLQYSYPTETARRVDILGPLRFTEEKNQGDGVRKRNLGTWNDPRYFIVLRSSSWRSRLYRESEGNRGDDRGFNHAPWLVP